MGELAARTIFSNETGPLAGTGLDTLAKNQTAILELEGAQAPQSKTIASGSISPTAAYVIVDTEGSAAADDLDVISPVLSASENLHDGMVVYLKSADSGRVVTVKNSGSANGINTYDGNDYVLSTTHWLKLQLRADGRWYEIEGRAMETALAAATAAAAASTAADHAQTKSGTSSTASGTADKVVTCSGFELSDQARVFITFDNPNTVADAITLNVNGTGAKAIYNQTGIISTSNTALFAANQPIEFRYDGTGWVYESIANVVTPLLSGKADIDLGNVTGNAIKFYLHVCDEKAGGSVGGSTSANSWHTRDLNTIKTNLIGATLASNRITLPAGDYWFRGYAPGYATGSTALAVHSTSPSAADLLVGESANVGAGTQSSARVEGKITLIQTTTLELRMWVANAQTLGLGIGTVAGAGVVAKYAEVYIWKL